MSRALEEQRPHLFGFLSYSHVTKQCLQQHIYLFYKLANDEQAELQKNKKQKHTHTETKGMIARGEVGGRWVER